MAVLAWNPQDLEALPTFRAFARQRILQLFDSEFSPDFLARHVPSTLCLMAQIAAGSSGGSVNLTPANGGVLLTEGRGFRLVASEFAAPGR